VPKVYQKNVYLRYIFTTKKSTTKDSPGDIHQGKIDQNFFTTKDSRAKTRKSNQTSRALLAAVEQSTRLRPLSDNFSACRHPNAAGVGDLLAVGAGHHPDSARGRRKPAVIERQLSEGIDLLKRSYVVSTAEEEERVSNVQAAA
jgi:hypothetical protein